MPEEVLYDVSNEVAKLTINRPERANAMSFDVMTQMRYALHQAKVDSGVKVVILQGAGDKAFCSGADLMRMSEDVGLVAMQEARGELVGLFEDLWSLGKPTIARVQGFALAGGFGLALACDMVIASEGARFGTPEVNVGLWPYMITVPLIRSMPPKKALELMLTGRLVDAEEASRIGFVNKVVPAAELDAAVEEMAFALASKSPVVMKLGRSSFYQVLEMSADQALPYLQSLLTLTSLTEDAKEGMAAFIAKRQPNWVGR
ncbi:MAG: enoyl-CoA hydratase-related protein [Actinobacteria bacterium]|jgi:enoyl-CoA hydratase/carnithine racemase|nr:enoyl-CoA hydratase-related protein [Actinomycetota bacterium]MCL6094476.1 enoyl-CoA hydratase-related protein [Actinomycetota bacterium]